ncbi:xanthine dehydrogenase family protein molybdopterin-binding subunit (plasmid) [Nitrobacteraceae bacterium UC4446_H13]
MRKNSGLGASLRRYEDDRLIIGAGSFGDDLNLPGQAYAVMVRSPYAHARIKSIKIEAALAQSGILAVLTAADYVADGLKPVPLRPITVSPPDIPAINADGTPIFIPPCYPLALDRARFVGEGVAWVVGESIELCKSAAELVEVEYEELMVVCDSRAAIDPASVLLWDDLKSNVVLDGRAGNAAAVDEAFQRARHVVRLDALVPRQTGAPMEPRTAAASYDPVAGKVTLYAGGGSVTRPRGDLMHMLNLSNEQVRVVARDVGGNFGTKNYTFPEFALSAWAAMKLGRPVKWNCERIESFLSDFHGRDLAVEAELALDETGKFLALRSTNLSNLGAYPFSFIPLLKGTELMSSLYDIPAASARAIGVCTNTPPTAPLRSAGRPEAMFVMERLIDLAAKKCGFDRLELRRRNLIPRASLPYNNPYGMEYDSGDYPGVFEIAVELADIAGFPERKAESESRGLKRGIGFGNYIESATGAPYERAIVTIHPEGKISVIIGTLSAGQGHDTSFRQVVVEFLGVSPDAVEIRAGDTDVATVGGGSHSGRSMRHATTTIAKASREIIARGTRLAALLLQLSEHQIDFHNGKFSSSAANRSIDLFELAKAALEQREIPEELRGVLQATADVHSTVASFPFGSHVSEVEVDIETGAVTVARYVAVDDVGRAVNPMTVDGQTHGGIAMGIGEALMEKCVYSETGEMLSASFMDYAMPRASDLPSFTTHISEVPSTTHPHGLRGGSEGGVTPTLSVVCNAVLDALAEFDIDHIELPLTPEHVWKAIASKRSR